MKKETHYCWKREGVLSRTCHALCNPGRNDSQAVHPCVYCSLWALTYNDLWCGGTILNDTQNDMHGKGVPERERLTLAGGMRPAAVVWPAKKRSKW